jgi:hypothetical protein
LDDVEGDAPELRGAQRPVMGSSRGVAVSVLIICSNRRFQATAARPTKPHEVEMNDPATPAL